MVGWIKCLIYIMSLIIPPVGVVTFWVLSGRDGELKEIARWSFFAAFVGFMVWVIIAAIGGMTHQMFWRGMGRW